MQVHLLSTNGIIKMNLEDLVNWLCKKRKISRAKATSWLLDFNGESKFLGQLRITLNPQQETITRAGAAGDYCLLQSVRLSPTDYYILNPNSIAQIPSHMDL